MKKLYIIHGWTYSIEPWTATVSILRTKGIEVKQLRVPGLTAESPKEWNIDGYVEWLKGELKGDKHPVVLGHSNGGRISLNFLVKYPGRIDRLILLNSAGVYEHDKRVSLRRTTFRMLAKLLKPLKYIPLVRKVVYRVIGGSDYDRAPAHMKRTLHNMLESDKRLELDGIDTPTAILWGEKDAITPLGQGQKMARQLPNASIKTFKDWGHAPYLTHPNELAAAIIAALEEG